MWQYDDPYYGWRKTPCKSSTPSREHFFRGNYLPVSHAGGAQHMTGALATCTLRRAFPGTWSGLRIACVEQKVGCGLAPVKRNSTRLDSSKLRKSGFCICGAPHGILWVVVWREPSTHLPHWMVRKLRRSMLAEVLFDWETSTMVALL